MDNDKPRNPFESISIAPADEGQAPAGPDLAGDAGPALSVDERPGTAAEGQQLLAGPLFPRERARAARGVGWLKWPAWLAAVAFASYLLAGYLLVPYLCRTYLARKLSVLMERPVTVGAAAFSPFTLTLTLDNAIVGPRLSNPRDTVDPIFSFGRFEVDFEAASLIKMGLICRQVRLDRFFLHAVRQPDGRYNVSELLPPLLADQTGKEGAARPDGFFARPLRFSLNNISLTNGRLIFDDQPAGATHSVEQINLALPVLSNLSYRTAEYIRPEFSAKINGSPMTITGETEISGQGIDTRLKLRLASIDLPAYLAYLPAGGALKLAGGRADLNGECVFSTQKSGPERLQISGALQVKDLRIVAGPEGRELAALPELTASGVFLPLAGRLHLAEVVARQPEFHLERTAAGGVNLAAGGWLGHGGLLLDRLLVSDAKLNFIDRTMTPKHVETWAVQQMSLEEYAAEPEADQQKPAAFSLQAEKKNGAEKSGLKVEGTITTRPWQAVGTMEFTGISLADYHAYWNGLVTADSPMRDMKGRLTLTGNFSWPGAGPGSPGLVLSKAEGILRDLTLTAAEQQWLVIPSLSFKEARLDTPGRRLDFGRLRALEGSLLLGLPARADVAPAAAADAGQGSPPPVVTGAGWTVGLKSLNLDRLEVRLPLAAASAGRPPAADSPAGQSPVIRLSEVALQFSEPAAGQEEQTGTITPLAGTASINESGRLQCEGSIRPGAAPLSAALDCRLDALELAAITELVPAEFAGRFAAGRLQAQGALMLPNFSFAGTAAILDFKSKATAMGPVGEQELVRWGTAEARNLRYTALSGGLSAERIVVREPRLLWDLQPQTSTSLATELLGLLPPLAAAGQDGLRSAVGAVDLAEGEIMLVDPTTSPAFRAKISAISGSLAREAEQTGSSSRLVLQGSYNGEAPVQADCRLEPFSPKPAVECQFKATGLNLAALSPYLAPHLGSGITDGKLALLADFQQAQGNVVAATHLEVTDFVPDSKGRDLNQLALVQALLTDQDNTMSLDIPLAGRLDDPAFSIRSGLVKALRTMMLKTPAEPFSVLDPLIRIETPQAAPIQDPGKVFFAAGSAELTADGRKKLQLLAIIAQHRPLLALEVTGLADARLDRETMVAARQKSAEYQRAVEEARQAEAAARTYGKEDARSVGRALASRPPDDAGKKVPPITITDRQLLDLAAARGQRVRQYLLDEAGVAAQQVMIERDAKLIPTDSPGKTGNRVDFRLRPVKGE